ncbi:MAG: asparagine synthase-related protein, partial [Terriglobia bacterium]
MPREWAEPQLNRMVEKLRHESFYTSGTWIDESLGIYAGWVARKGSFSDGMPLRNETGDRVLIFAGEEFPEPGTAARLKARGHAVEAGGPSYLVHLAEEDAEFPKCLNGTFHGLLADQAGGSATLFNDRYGLQRLYYHEAKEAFYFAAEAKAILAVRPELRRLDPRGLGEYVSCGCVMEDRTLFEGIHALPPGSAWTFRNGRLEAKRAYFDPREWEEQEHLEPEAWYRELKQVFQERLPRYFNGRERVAMSLTGGLDSRMILAWHQPAPGSLPFYTFGSTYRDNTDVIGARRVAQACKQSHQVIVAGKEMLSRFPSYAERAVYITEGGVEANRGSTLYCNAQARSIAPVRITGNYGTEVLRPVRAFKPVRPMPGLFRPELLPQIDEARNTYARLIETHPVSFSAFRQAPWLHWGNFMLEGSQVSMRSPYLDNDLVRTIYRAPLPMLASAD